MKKILFCIPNLMDGGAEKVLVNLVNNLDSTKYEITILTVVDCGINKKFLNKQIHYKSIFKKYFRGSSVILRLFSPSFIYKKYIGNNYDIVIAYLEGVASRIVSGCSSENTKKIAWIHTELSNSDAFVSGFRNFDEALACYSSFDKIACVSKSVKSAFQKITKIKIPIEVLYNTNETELIREKSKEEVDDIYINPDIFNLCSVGKIIESKGFDRIARIHKKLIEEGIMNHIYILGQGKEQCNIENYLESNGLSNSFTFIGYKQNPYKYIAKCDLYICASQKEGFSTAVTESLIVGTPVVTTLCSGMIEMLGDNNEYGIITDNNEDALFDEIRKLLNDKKLLESYKLKAEARGKQFSKKSTVLAVEKMLDNI